MRFSRPRSLGIRRLRCLALMATLSAAAGAHAQAFDAVRLFAAPPGKSGGITGSVVLASATHAGSRDRRTLVLPVLDYQWANGWFAGTGNGLGFNVSNRPELQYGLRLTADFGRKEKRSAALRGLGDIPARAEIGGFYNRALPRGFSLSTSLRYGSGRGSDGLVADVGIGYSLAFAERWRFGVGTSASVVNAASMRSSFGITPEQAARSGYARYTPSAGLRELRTGVTLSHRFSPRSSVTLGLSAATLADEAADSPLVRQRTNVAGLLVATVAF